MRARPYPLETVRKLRTQAQQVAAEELARARTRLSDSEAAHQKATDAVASVLAERSQLLGPAATSGAELARSGAYDVRLRASQSIKQAALKQAAAELKQCTRAVKLAELAFHQAYVEREVIERHHARFAEAERKRAARAADDEEDDLNAIRKR